MKLFAAFLILVTAATGAEAETEAWVQAVAGPNAYEVRAVTTDAACPPLQTGNIQIAMAVRAPANDAFPLVCAAPLPADATAPSVDGVALPLPVAVPSRILVLGDTGCRIKGSALQACNDPAAWPFPTLAQAAARMKPDLVIHLGDYLYREQPCPAGNQGCAGSPSGDNWPSWRADFFAPTMPLFKAAPWVTVRGNHEDCARAGLGFLRLLGPSAFDGACAPHLPPFTVSLGGPALAVMDDADAPDTEVSEASVPVYASELQGFAGDPQSFWLATHRPIWAVVTGPLDLPVGGNATLIAAAGRSLIPGNVALMLSGHIHTFEAINYDGRVPPQIVAGNGGDNLDVTPRDLKGAMFQGHSGVRVKDGLSVGGFGFLLLTRGSDHWTVDLYDTQGNGKGECLFTPGQPGRLDCPDLEH